MKSYITRAWDGYDSIREPFRFIITMGYIISGLVFLLTPMADLELEIRSKGAALMAWAWVMFSRIDYVRGRLG